MKKITKSINIRLKDVKRRWFIVDAKNKILGRFACRLARILTGKDKAEYSPNLDCGDFIVVINSEQIRTTGKKLTQKQYFRHSGYPGGMKLIHLEKMLEEHPEIVINEAVKGMLPHNRLGRKIIKKLKIYRGEVHPHKSQKLEELTV